MPAITFAQLQSMHNEAAEALVDELATHFLGLFERGKPLDKDEFDRWRLHNSLDVPRVKLAAVDALKCGWITSTEEGMFITDAGLRKAEGGCTRATS